MKRYKRREFLKTLGSIGLGLGAGAVLSRIPSVQALIGIPSPEKIISPSYPLFPAMAMVYKRNEYAVAVDNLGKPIAESSEHADVIQSAIDHVADIGGGRVVLTSVFNVNKTIYLRKGVDLVGVGGLYQYEEDKVYGSGLLANMSDPILSDYEGLEQQYIEGLAIVNKGGMAIKFDDPFLRLYILKCDIFAKTYGIYAIPGVTAHELTVAFSRLTSDTGEGSGSVGIYFDSEDNEIMMNIIRGFDVGIKLAGSANNIIQNHIYKYPASAISTCIEVGKSKNVVLGNYLEGLPSVGIKCIDVCQMVIIGNRFKIRSGGYGVLFDFTTSNTLAYVVVTNNYFEGESATAFADRDVKFGANVSGFWRVEVHGNVHMYVTNITVKGMYGLEYVTSLPDASEYPGRIVLYYDPDTGSYYIAVSDGSVWRKVAIS